MSSSSLAEHAAALRSVIDDLGEPLRADDIGNADLQELIAAAVRLYASRVERDGGFPIVPARSLTATDAMISTTALLRATNVQVFELGCWQGWAG